jgi:hypothetical protein
MITLEEIQQQLSTRWQTALLSVENWQAKMLRQLRLDLPSP